MTNVYVTPQYFQRPNQEQVTLPGPDARKKLSLMGAQTACIVGGFLTDDGLVDEAGYKAALRSMSPGRGPLVIEYEFEIDHLISDKQRDAKIEACLWLLKVAKGIHPEAQVGFYGLPWATTDEGVTPEWATRISGYARLLMACDALYPSLYLDIPAMEREGDAAWNKRYARQIVKTCKKYKRTVIPFFSARYFNEGKPWDLCEVLTLDFLAAAREAVNAGISGAILWSRDGELFLRFAQFDDFPRDHPVYMDQMRAKCILSAMQIPVPPNINNAPDEVKAEVLKMTEQYVDRIMIGGVAMLDHAMNGGVWGEPIHGGRPSFVYTPKPPVPPVQPPSLETVGTSPFTVEKMDDGSFHIMDTVGSFSQTLKPVPDAAPQPIPGVPQGWTGIVDIDVLTGVLDAWGEQHGGATMDDLLTVINAWGKPCIRPTSHGTGTGMFVGDDHGAQNLIMFCADNAITKGFQFDGNSVGENLLVIGSWQAFTFGLGANVHLKKCRAIRSRAQPQGGGYGGWSDAAKITAEDCLFACSYDSWQYSFRSTGTQLLMTRCTFIGDDGKAYNSRMTQSTGNKLVDCTWIGTIVSLGGGEAGPTNPDGSPAMGQFSGEIINPTFKFLGNQKCQVQPGVDGLKFSGTVKTNRLDWLGTDAAAHNVTNEATTIVLP